MIMNKSSILLFRVSLGDADCNPETLLDFYIVVLGAFSINPKTPSINALIEKAKEEVTSHQTPLIVPTDQCCLFAQGKILYVCIVYSILLCNCQQCVICLLYKGH